MERGQARMNTEKRINRQDRQGRQDFLKFLGELGVLGGLILILRLSALVHDQLLKG